METIKMKKAQVYGATYYTEGGDIYLTSKDGELCMLDYKSMDKVKQSYKGSNIMYQPAYLLVWKQATSSSHYGIQFEKVESGEAKQIIDKAKVIKL